MVDVLRRHAELEPERVHVHLLEDHGGQDISYSQLLSTASQVAAGLTNAGLKRDETVAIMLPTCSDFFYALLRCNACWWHRGTHLPPCPSGQNRGVCQLGRSLFCAMQEYDSSLALSRLEPSRRS